MNKKNNVYLMYIIVFLQGFVFYGPIATVYRLSRGISMYDMFIIESISWILMIIFEVPWGWFADRFGYKKTIVISNFIFFISKIVFFKSYTFEMFLIERILLSLSLAGISGCDTALIYSSVDKGLSEKIFGRYNAFSTGGFLIASFVSTFVIGFSIDMAVFLTIIPYGAAALISLFIKDVEVNKKEKTKFKNSLIIAFKNKQLIVFVFSVALAREVVQSVTVFLNQTQYVRSGIDIKYFGILMALVQIVRFSSVKAYSLSSKFGKSKVIQILYITLAISCSLLIFTTNPIISVACVILASWSMAIIEPMATDIQNKSITIGDRATILSIYAMIGDLTSALINPIVGKSANISIMLSFKVCAGICIITCILFLLLTLILQNKKSNWQYFQKINMAHCLIPC